MALSAGNEIRGVKKILILELGGIGDVILAVPAILGIRQAYPDSHATVVTVRRARTVLERFAERYGRHLADGTTTVENRAVGLARGVPLSREDLSFFLSLRREEFDLLVDLSAIESTSADLRRRLLVRTISAGTSAGRGTDGRGSYFDIRTVERLDGRDHEMERKLAVASGLGVTRSLSAPIFPILQHERDEAEEFFARHGIDDRAVLAAIHPGGTGAHKRWPAERFGRAACWLSENLGARVVVVGGPENERIMEQVRSAGRGEAVISAPFLSLGAVAALLERCSLFLTNDSGPMHLAAALGVPTVAIFGQTNHDRYAPLLPDSRKECAYADPGRCPEGWTGRENEECRKSDCTHIGCLEAVSVDEVIGKLETLCSRIGLFYHVQPVDRPDETTHPADVEDRQPEDADVYGAGGRSAGAAASSGSGDRERREPGAPAIHTGSGNGNGGSGDTGGLPPADAGYITRRARKRAIGLIRGTDGGTILDVACGKGYLIRDLTEGRNGSRRTFGVDISMEQLRSAKIFEGGGNGSGLVRGDVGRLPFRSGMFDATVCVNTFLNLAGGDTLTACLFEMARVTRTGGTVLVELRNARNPLVGFRFLVGKLLHGVPLHVHRLGDVLASGKKAGLVLTSKHSVGPPLGPFSYSSILEFEKEGD